MRFDRLHEKLAKFTYYYFGWGLGIVLVGGLINIGIVKILWALVLFPACIMVAITAWSRFLDDRYLTLHQMKPEEIQKILDKVKGIKPIGGK